MTLKEILAEWDKDSQIDMTRLTSQAAEVPKLHAKYLRWYHNEKMILHQLKNQQKLYRLQKWEHYTQGPNEDTKDWKMPASGKIMKSEAESYVDADDDVRKREMKIKLQEEKVGALETIVSNVNFRGNLFSTIMTHARWEGGA